MEAIAGSRRGDERYLAVFGWSEQSGVREDVAHIFFSGRRSGLSLSASAR